MNNRGLTYVHVIPDDWGSFVDVRACWQHAHDRHPWIEVIRPEDLVWQAKEAGNLWVNPQVIFVCWDLPRSEAFLDILRKRDGKGAKIAAVFFEAMSASPKRMLPAHREFLGDFLKIATSLDGVLVHTPSAIDFMRSIGIKADLLPVGWDPEVMGLPRWGTRKHHDYMFYGSRVGKRALVVPFLLDRLGAKLVDRSGHFGRGTAGALDNARANLYLAHSDVDSFSTWRIWQCVASSAALVAEPGDAWPLTMEHFLEIPRITLENAEEVPDRLVQILDTDLEGLARKLHGDLGPEFTIDKIIERYLLPFGEALFGGLL